MKITALLILLFVWAQIALSNSEIYFTYLTRDQGLSDNHVECILKDSEGFIWFGTRNGLCRYDGYDIKIYNKQNGLSGNRILSICEDYSGNLWIGTYKDGLNKFDKATETFYHFGVSSGIGHRVNKILAYSDSSIWVGSDRGVAKISGGSTKIFTYDDGLNTGLIYDIIETQSGDIFIATENIDIQKLNKTTYKFENIKYKRDPALNSNYRKQIIEDENGVLWITASYHGLANYNPNTGDSEIYTDEDNYLSTSVLMGNMAIDKNGKIWICTEEDGINIFDPVTKTYEHIHYKKDIKGGLNSNQTYTIYFDNDNIAWIGTFNKGVNIYNPYQQKFSTTLFKQNDLDIINGYSVLDIYEDSQNRIWIGTDGNGLFCFEKNKEVIHYKTESHPEMLTSNVIKSINEDPNGNLLLGMYSGGMSVVSPEINSFNKYIPNGAQGAISSMHVWDIVTDSKKRVWLGMLASGVDQFLYNEGKFLNHGPWSDQDFKIDFQNIMVIMEDSDGDIWFGTEGKGIYILDNQTNKVLQFESDTINDFATAGVIKCLYQDKWGKVWIGTEGDALYQYDKHKNSYIRYDAQNGFTNDPVKSIIEDHHGDLWIGTTSGLFMLDEQRTNFSKYIVEDGLLANDFNSDASIKLTLDKIIIGTKNGANIIAIDQIKTNKNIPKVVFTKLTVLGYNVKPGSIVNERVLLNKGIGYTNELVLTWKDKAFSIEFAALNYTLPQKCMYKYKLDGFDEDWTLSASDRRIATYSNLDAGKYTLKVRAANNDGVWGENEATLLITVKPPFWETLVFKALLVLLVFAIIYYLYKKRIEQQQEAFKKKELEQEKKIISLQNEQLEAELKKLAFSILSKNRMLMEQKQRIENLSNKAKVSVKEGLKKIVDKIDEDLDEEKDWKVIEPQIDKAYNHFISHLKQKHPDLTATEVRIAAYIRMNLSTKEICEIMNKTQRAIENDRYRLRKKIEIESSESLKDYFLNI